MLFGCQAGRDTCRSCADNYNIQQIGHALVSLRNNTAESCLALLHTVFDQAHATQFTGDIDPRHIGLVILMNVRKIHAAFFGSDDQGYCFHRTGVVAGAVAYTIGSIDEGSAAIHDAEDIVFGACGDTGATFDTGSQINYRMQGNGLKQPFLPGLFDFRFCFIRDLLHFPEIIEDNQSAEAEYDGVNDELFEHERVFR